MSLKGIMTVTTCLDTGKTCQDKSSFSLPSKSIQSWECESWECEPKKPLREPAGTKAIPSNPLVTIRPRGWEVHGMGEVPQNEPFSVPQYIIHTMGNGINIEALLETL